MPKATQYPGELLKLAKAHLLAKSAFNRAYCRFWQVDVNPCSDETGWKLLEVFRGKVEKFRFKLSRSERSIELAAWEIFRQQLVGQADYGFKDVVEFVKWYGALKKQIAVAIEELFEFHSDSFSDLVDSHPLAGRELVDRALASHPHSDRPRRDGYLDEREVREAVLQKLGKQWHNVICECPNYVESALQSACHRSYLHRILTDQDDQITWTEEEKSALDFAVRFDG